MLWRNEKAALGSSGVVTSATFTDWGRLLGGAALGLLLLPSEARANAPNFYMLLGTSAAMFATVPVTVLIESAVIKKFSNFSWPKTIVVACVLYIISTSIGSYIGGGAMFAIHPIFFDRGELFYGVVSTIIFSAINFLIEVLALLIIFKRSLGLIGTIVFFVANLATTAILLFAAYSGLFWN